MDSSLALAWAFNISPGGRRAKGYLLLLALGTVLHTGLMAQPEQQADSLEHTFARGKHLVSLAGFVSSYDFKNVQSGSNSGMLGNSYRFELKLGKFVAKRQTLGLQFFTNKTNLVGITESTADITSLGPFYRAYLGRSQSIAIIAQASLMGSSYISQSGGSLALNIANQEMRARGVHSSFGIGVCYVVDRRFAFEVLSEYNLARYWGEQKELTSGISEPIDLVQSGLKFSFGFSILFGKLNEGND